MEGRERGGEGRGKGKRGGRSRSDKDSRYVMFTTPNGTEHLLLRNHLFLPVQ